MAIDHGRPVKEIMTAPVVSVGLDATAQQVAEILITRHIGGVPVVDGEGRPVGVVSESDFLSGDEARRLERREAWLRIVAGGQALSEGYIADIGREAGRARQIMKSPAITADAETPVAEVIALLNRHRIKRIPITRGGSLAGIVTRADLLRHVVPEASGGALPDDPGPGQRAATPGAAGKAGGALRAAPGAAKAGGAESFSAALLRRAVAAFKSARHDAALEAAEAERRRAAAEIAALLDAPYTDREWHHLLATARRAAETGLAECPALRFPAKLCTDGGRAINVGLPDWPGTLRGKPARFFLRWKSELQPAGFRLSAYIASFPGGLPGDVELTLIWGSDD